MHDVDCDFEAFAAPCKWVNNMTRDEFKWEIVTGSSIGGDGPSVDHTLGSPDGHFIVPAFTSFKPYKGAVYYSAEVKGINCISFWIYLYGSETGLFNVRAFKDGSSTRLITREDHSLPHWVFMQSHYVPTNMRQSYSFTLEIFQRYEPFNVRSRLHWVFITSTLYIEIISYSKGYIAIDDIVAYQGYCVTTDLCTFEEPSIYCNYNIDTLTDFMWQRGNGTFLKDRFDINDVKFHFY